MAEDYFIKPQQEQILKEHQALHEGAAGRIKAVMPLCLGTLALF